MPVLGLVIRFKYLNAQEDWKSSVGTSLGSLPGYKFSGGPSILEFAQEVKIRGSSDAMWGWCWDSAFQYRAEVSIQLLLYVESLSELNKQAPSRALLVLQILTCKSTPDFLGKGYRNGSPLGWKTIIYNLQVSFVHKEKIHSVYLPGSFPRRHPREQPRLLKYFLPYLDQGWWWT